MSPAHFEWPSDAHPAEETTDAAAATQPRHLQQSSDATETPPNELVVASGNKYAADAWPSLQAGTEYLTPSEQGSLDSGSEWSWPDDSEGEADSTADQGTGTAGIAGKADNETVRTPHMYGVWVWKRVDML